MAAPTIDVSALFSLASKTAIVTGGTGGLGMAMTTALASAGANIISIELSDDPGHAALKSAIAQTNRSLKTYTCDVRDPKSLRGVYQQIWADGNKADVLLNCAGVQRRADAEDFTDDDIELVLDVNLKAILISCQEFAKPLLKEGGLSVGDHHLRLNADMVRRTSWEDHQYCLHHLVHWWQEHHALCREQRR
jgi:2-deoxy-D-gluconate 3-dehydrogenase